MAWGMHGGLQGEAQGQRSDARDIYGGPEYQRMDADEQRRYDAREWSLGMYELMNTPFGEWMGKKGFIPKDFDEFNKKGWTDAIFDTGFVTDIPPKNNISFYLEDGYTPAQKSGGGFLGVMRDFFSGQAPHQAEGRDE